MATDQEIERLLDACETQQHCFWNKELIVSYRLPCGFTISGRAAIVDPDNFSMETGQQIARGKAKQQLWLLEAYVEQLELAGYIQVQCAQR